mmetsp:Transcript_5858/g.16409  ORF Transcript_5858/g.16409 Transcript_5858/m.16409 type:complete len:142 (+) Transcript_5858:97-522(+)
MASPKHANERAALLVDSSGPQTTRLSPLSSGRSWGRGERERDLAVRPSGLGRDPRAFLSVERLRSLYPVAIFCVTSALLFADQNLMAPNLTDIARSFDFDEHERDKYLGGYIGAVCVVAHSRTYPHILAQSLARSLAHRRA